MRDSKNKREKWWRGETETPHSLISKAGGRNFNNTTQIKPQRASSTATREGKPGLRATSDTITNALQSPGTRVFSIFRRREP